MSEEFYGKGIIVASGFDLSAKSPLDTRSIVNTIEERNAHVTGNRVYEGMKVYVLAEKKEYRYNGNDWEEVGGITDEQLEKLTIAYEHSQTPHVTEEYVDAKIAEASLGGEVDLSSYATKTDLNSKVDKVEGKSLISDTEIERLANVTNYDDTEIKAELNNKANISDLHQHSNKEVLDGITAEKVTSWDNKSDFNGSYNDLTNKPSIPTKTSELVNDSDFATKTDLNSKVDKIEGKGLSTNDYTNEEKNKLNSIEEGANNYIHPTEHEASMIVEDSEHRFVTDLEKSEWSNKSDFSGSYNDLTNKPNIPSKTSELINDSDFATNGYVNEMLGGKRLIYLTQAEYDILTEAEKNNTDIVYNITDSSEEYVTKTELESKGYLTEHQSLSNYATKDELHNHTNKAVLDGITTNKITSWDNKSNFSGSYNDLTNKPSIPTKTSELVNDSTYITESGVSEIIENSVEVSQGGTAPTKESVLLWIDTTSVENIVENNLSDSLIAEFQNSISTLNTRVSTLEQNTGVSAYTYNQYSIPTSLPTNGGNVDTVSGYTIWTGTQAEYDAISSKNPTTIYFIKG